MTAASSKQRMTPARAERESKPARRQRTAEILERLEEEYPDSDCALEHADAFELLVATILSAQCTDERVNKVTPELFERFPRPVDLAAADLEEIEESIRSTGFYRNKARALKGLGEALIAEHDGEVPATMDELTELPGVGRKTANVVLGNAFEVEEGIVVDTHVGRLSRRLGLSRETDAVKVERDLLELVPEGSWTLWSHLLIDHGRAVCKARQPRCPECVLVDLCPSAEV